MEKEKLLGDIPIATGSGHNMSVAVNTLLGEWGINGDSVIAFSFDTTSSNTGVVNGKKVVERLIEEVYPMLCNI